MFKITLKDNTFVNVEKDQAELIVESLFEHISGIRLLSENEVQMRQEIADRLAEVGIDLSKVEAMGFDVKPNGYMNMRVKIPNGNLDIEYSRDGDLVKLAGDFFNNNEMCPISGGATIQDLISDAESQYEYLTNKYPEDDSLALLPKVIEDWKSITTDMNEAESDTNTEILDLETEEPDSTLVTECTTSGSVASVASPVGKPADPIKRPKVKVKRI